MPARVQFHLRCETSRRWIKVIILSYRGAIKGFGVITTGNRCGDVDVYRDYVVRVLS